MADRYVATTGVIGNLGTLVSPWDLASAATGHSGAILPGDTVWVRGGTYDVTQLSFSVSGLSALLPVIFRNYNGEHAIIRGTSASSNTDDQLIDGNYIWLWGLDFTQLMRSRLIAAAAPTGWNTWIRNTTNGCRFIHCVNHDKNNGWFSDPGTGDVEIYGSIAYNMGFDLPATGGQNHGFYLHHNDGGGATTFRVEDCISFNHHLACFQMYSGGAAEALQGIKVRRGIFFNAAAWATLQNRGTTIFFGGDVAPPIRGEISDCVCHWPSALPGEVHIDIGKPGIVGDNVQVLRNYMTYGGGQSAWASLHIPGRFTASASNFQFKNNFIKVATSGANKALYFNALDNDLVGFDISHNTWINNPANTSWVHANGTSDTFAAYKSATGLSATDTASASDPTVNVVVVTPTTRYESGRGHVWYYNWQSLANIPVDLSSILLVGDTYTVHDVRDIWGAAVVSGTYLGGTVNFPTTQVTDPALTANAQVNISDSTPTTPIQITTATPHGYLNGDVVRIANHLINTNANGVRAITLIDSTNFTLNGSTFNGDGVATGTVNATSGVSPVATAPFFNAFLVRRTSAGSVPPPQPGALKKFSYNFATGSVVIYAHNKEDADFRLYYNTQLGHTIMGSWDIQSGVSIVHNVFGALQSITSAVT